MTSRNILKVAGSIDKIARVQSRIDKPHGVISYFLAIRVKQRHYSNRIHKIDEGRVKINSNNNNNNNNNI